jgi:acyl-CoA thioester hydrolase
MERSRTELLRDQGIELCEYQKENILFAVVEAHVKYRRSAKYNDLLDVESTLSDLSSIMVSFRTEIRHNDQLLVVGNVSLACVSAEGKARRIPARVKEALEGLVSHG